MKTSSKANRKKSAKEISKHIDAAVKALAAAVSEDPASEKGFGDYESTVLEISNEICRRVLSNRLEGISQQNETDFFFDKQR